MKYCVGFLFSPLHTAVALIRKTKPAWQVGKLNGVGGKLEPGETAHDAMVREFQEEAGIEVPRWEHAIQLVIQDDTIDFFSAVIPPGGYLPFPSPTDEIVEWYNLRELDLRNDVIPNLVWMVPLAKQRLEGKTSHATAFLY